MRSFLLLHKLSLPKILQPLILLFLLILELRNLKLIHPIHLFHILLRNLSFHLRSLIFETPIFLFFLSELTQNYVLSIEFLPDLLLTLDLLLFRLFLHQLNPLSDGIVLLRFLFYHFCGFFMHLLPQNFRTLEFTMNLRLDFIYFGLIQLLHFSHILTRDLPPPRIPHFQVINRKNSKFSQSFLVEMRILLSQLNRLLMNEIYLLRPFQSRWSLPIHILPARHRCFNLPEITHHLFKILILELYLRPLDLVLFLLVDFDCCPKLHHFPPFLLSDFFNCISFDDLVHGLPSRFDLFLPLL